MYIFFVVKYILEISHLSWSNDVDLKP